MIQSRLAGCSIFDISLSTLIWPRTKLIGVARHARQQREALEAGVDAAAVSEVGDDELGVGQGLAGEGWVQQLLKLALAKHEYKNDDRV